MKELKKHQLQFGEHYLVFTDEDWSPSGYDIAQYDRTGGLISQCNGEDLLKQLRSIKIYELPTT